MRRRRFIELVAVRFLLLMIPGPVTGKGLPSGGQVAVVKGVQISESMEKLKEGTEITRFLKTE